MDKKRVKGKELSEQEKVKAKENKFLSRFFIVILLFFLAIIVAFFIMKSPSHTKYNGITFNVIKEGELIFYEVPFNVANNGKPAVYNIYLRNEPKKLNKEIPFKGELELKNYMVLDVTTENLFCDGDWNIAIGNMLNLNIFNIEIMKDENAGCDPEGEYMFVQIEEGEKSMIEQTGPSCYKLIVSDCEVLPVTERFMIEVFSEVNKHLEK